MPVNEVFKKWGADLPNDQFGYARYNLAAFAPAEIISKVSPLQEAVKQNELFPLPPHVTVNPIGNEITDLDAIKSAIGSITNNWPSFYISFESAHYYSAPEFGAAGVEISAPEEMMELQRAIEAAIKPYVVESNYPEDQKYRKHLNYALFQEGKEFSIASTMGEEIDLRPGFEVTSIDLTGRTSALEDNRIDILETFHLAPGSQES